MSEFLAALGLKWVPGFLGALVSLKFIDGLTPMQRVSTVAAGTLVAYYCGPLAVDLLGLSSKMEGAVSFLVGLFAMSLAGAAITAIPEWVAAARKKWLGGT